MALGTYNNTNTERRRNSFFRRIDSRQAAAQVIDNTANIFLVLAVLQLISGIVTMLVDPNEAIGFIFLASVLIYGALALWLKNTQSRVAAVLLLVLSVLSLVNILTGGILGLIVSVIILIAAIRGTIAAFKLHQMRIAEPSMVE